MQRLSNPVLAWVVFASILPASRGYAQTCSERIAQPSYGIGIDMNGNVWVPQHLSGILRKYSPDGSLPGPNTFDMQTSYYRGVAVTPVDNDVWVGGSRRNNAFDLVDGDTGAILKTFDVGVGGHGGIIACDNVLWSVSKTGLPGVFWYDTNQDITASVCCTPDILADSNNDFVFDELDQSVEDMSPGMAIYVNDDDDNQNGTPDMNENPVLNEDDLVALQLFAGCFIDDPAAKWLLSWPGPAPDPDSISIWLNEDKSGSPILNGQLNDWPPPDVVWLETLAASAEFELTFQILPDGVPQACGGPERLCDGVGVAPAPRYPIKLRIVMVVEDGADLDNPPDFTGGCKLTQLEVANFVLGLIQNETITSRGLKWDWDGTIHKLEAKCMKLLGPLQVSVCGALASGSPGSFGNPRRVGSNWFSLHVVNAAPGNESGAWLVGYGDQSDSQCPPPPGGIYCDGYDPDTVCAVNVYFTGNVRVENPGEPTVNYTPAFSDIGAKPYAVINDGAGIDTSNHTDLRFLETFNALTHELACHLLPPYGEHSAGASACPNDMCMEGVYLQTCWLLGYPIEGMNGIPAALSWLRIRNCPAP